MPIKIVTYPLEPKTNINIKVLNNLSPKPKSYVPKLQKFLTKHYKNYDQFCPDINIKQNYKNNTIEFSRTDNEYIAPLYPSTKDSKMVKNPVEPIRTIMTTIPITSNIKKYKEAISKLLYPPKNIKTPKEEPIHENLMDKIKNVISSMSDLIKKV